MKRKRKLRNIAIAIAAIIAILAVYIYIIGRDIAPADFSDLALPIIYIAPEENAYTYFVKATEALVSYPSEDKYSDPISGAQYIRDSLTNATVVAQVLLDNEEVFNYLRQGIQYQECVLPMPTSTQDSFPPVAKPIEAMQLLLHKIMYEQSKGNFDSAIDDSHTLLRYGQLTRQMPPTFITLLVGLAIEKAGLQKIQQLARNNSLSTEQLNRLLELVFAIPPYATATQNAVKGYFRVLSFELEEYAEGKRYTENLRTFYYGPDDKYEITLPFFKHMLLLHRTQLYQANLHRTVISEVPKFYSDINFDALTMPDPYEDCSLWRNLRKILFERNYLGKRLVHTAGLLDETTPRLRCEIDGTLAATKIIIASHLFERTTGRRPQTLDELVPDFLPSIPLDPFDGKPFRTNPDKGVIYSVGTSLKDLGGLGVTPDSEPSESMLERVKDNPWKGDNAVFQIWE